MCGIAGLFDPDWRGTGEELAGLAQAMATALAHRGPDDHGTWCDPAAGVGFGHRRLAVIDLSPAGHQPMVSADGRWVACYNGECYNAPELRAELPGRGKNLRGHCDTEVVVEAVAAWGLRDALARINGMFAVALWDRRDRALHLVRDRLGEKPLYYAVIDGTLLFGSELRALLAHPRFRPSVDRQAVALLVRLNYIPAPWTIYSGARKLAAGHLITFRPGQAGWPEPSAWWDFAAVANSARSARPDATAATQDSLDNLDGLLRDAVARRLVADVPVGVFLSGGIDSSLVTALAQSVASEPVRTFTIGFAGEGVDEAGYAAAVARHLATDHTRIDVTPDDAQAALPSLATRWDEPFADPSQLPTALLCRETRRHVTVALSGDGGDEMFGGYRRYTTGAGLSRRLLPVPKLLRRAGAAAIDAVPPAFWDRAETIGHRLAPRLVAADLGTKAHKLAHILPAETADAVYVGLVSSWEDPESVVLGIAQPGWPGPQPMPWTADPAEAMMAWDTLSTLPDEMLVKVDRASMSVSLEVRPPLLDHRVVDAAWSLPPTLRVDGSMGKRALRFLLDRYVPRQLVARPKTGFDPPIGAWLRDPLRPWAEDLLSPSRLRAQGLIDPAPVRACWSAHLAGRPGRTYALWSVLMLQSWLDANPSSLARCPSSP
jgi:asparagine synthase (glutamine-hydrolysing)